MFWSKMFFVKKKSKRIRSLKEIYIYGHERVIEKKLKNLNKK